MIKGLKIISKDKIEIYTDLETILVVGKGQELRDVEDYDFFINGELVELDDTKKLDIFIYIRDNMDMKEYKYIGALEVYDIMINMDLNLYLKKMDKKKLINKITEILNILIQHEEYEKCADLNKIIENINI